MDIQQAMVPIPPKPKAKHADKPAAQDKPESVDERSGQTSAVKFSSLLKGLRQDDVQALDGAALSLQDQASLMAADLKDLPPGEVLTTALSLDDLLGQAQRLLGADAGATGQAAGLSSQAQGRGLGAQMHVAAGQQVATVAAGVQTVAQAEGASEAPAVVQSAATALLAQAADAAEVVEQLVTGDAQRSADASGRFSLQGNWTLDEGQAAMQPTLQRVMAQVEQWAGSAGVQARPGERADGTRSASASGVEALGGGQGSGTRLMDTAVREVQQAQDAMFEAQHDAPVEDMRFWLRGKQQRAEVVMEKDGQPVRVQVSVRGNEAHVTFRADQMQTRALLDDNVAQLRELLQQQGLELAGVQVQAQTDGDAAPHSGAQRHAWQDGPARHGVVEVPVQTHRAEAAPRVPQGRGLDLYA